MPKCNLKDCGDDGCSGSCGTCDVGRYCEASSCVGPPPGMVVVPAGSFVMGSPRAEPLRNDDEIQHRVQLTHALLAGVTEVTQAQWQSVMGDDPAEFSACGPDCPVESVSWYQAPDRRLLF